MTPRLLLSIPTLYNLVFFEPPFIPQLTKKQFCCTKLGEVVPLSILVMAEMHRCKLEKAVISQVVEEIGSSKG